MRNLLYVIAGILLFAVFYFAGAAAGQDPMPAWGIAAWTIVFGIMGAFALMIFLALVGCAKVWRTNPATRDLF